MGERRGRAWRAGKYLGLVTDEPKPAPGSRAWWSVVLYFACCGVVVVLVLHLVT